MLFKQIYLNHYIIDIFDCRKILQWTIIIRRDLKCQQHPSERW